MKLFSRKGLVAATTAVAIAAGSLSAPAMADTQKSDSSTSEIFKSAKEVLSSSDTQASELSTSGAEGENKEKSNTKQTIEKIRDILSIVSTVVAILGSLFPLISQIAKKFK
ncbi:hypothetical protein FRC0522_01279 [Corynebacterium diphtheriae]|nr:hypothetical protein FRC0522_01279 [Corynebacterium diphtheriae]